MPEKLSNGIAMHLSDEVQLEESTVSLAARYRNAKPFPHLVLHNLFPRDGLEELVREIGSIGKDGWVIHEDPRLSKENLRSAVYLGESGKRHAALLHSAEFLYLISDITGVWGLLPDPYLAGSGYHVLGAGGVFDVHADRNVDHNTGLTRRVAMITYLNHEWQPQYGGQLELWATDASRCEQVVEPLFNATILFEVGDANFHAVRPVQPPKGLARKSFATYFHTVGNAQGVTSKPHHSVYAPSVYHRPYNLKTIASEYMVPPGIVKAVRKVRERWAERAPSNNFRQ